MEKWSSQTALVTGASAGIGAAICITLVKSGLKVVGAARSLDKIKNLADELKDEKGELMAVRCDLTKDDDIYALFNTIKKTYGGVDICINNAGLAFNKSLLGGSSEEWRQVINVNVIALCLCTKLAVASMREKGIDDGHVINISRKDVKIKIDDIYINYESSGTKGKVALCLPGSMGCAETDFGPQLKELGSKGLEVICWDPPGYGKSRPPDRDFSSNFFQADCQKAAALMKTLGHDRYYLLGWSDGAITAVYLAFRYPESVEKMVVWGGNGFLGQKDLDLYAQVKDVRKWSEKMRRPMEQVYGPEYFRTTWEHWVDAMIRIYHESGGVLYTEKDLASISCPTLIIHGKKDPMVGEEQALYLNKRINNSKLVVWEEGKHNLHLRFAQEFNDLVAEFLQE